MNTRDVLTNALNLNFRKFNDNSLATYSELSSSRSLQDYYSRLRDSDVNSWMLDYTLALKRTLEPRKHEISSEIRYNRSHDNDDTNQSRLNLATAGAASTFQTEPSDLERDHTDALTQTLNAQLDYMRAYSPKTKLET